MNNAMKCALRTRQHTTETGRLQYYAAIRLKTCFYIIGKMDTAQGYPRINGNGWYRDGDLFD